MRLCVGDTVELLSARFVRDDCGDVLLVPPGTLGRIRNIEVVPKTRELYQLSVEIGDCDLVKYSSVDIHELKRTDNEAVSV